MSPELPPGAPRVPRPSRRRFLATGLAASVLAACRRSGSGASAVDTATTPTPAVPTAPTAAPATSATVAASATTTATTATTAPLQPARPVPGLSLVVGRPTDRSAAVSLLSDVDRTMTLHHRPLHGPPAATGTTSATGATSATGTDVVLVAGRPHHVELTGLAPATEHAYELVLADGSAGERTFRTGRPPGSTYVFTIDADPHYGDPRFDGELYRATLANVAADRPDFHVNLGDTFMTEKANPTSAAAATPAFAELRDYFGVLDGAVPMYLVNGNHEAELGWLAARAGTRELPLWSTGLRQAYYPHPVPGGFYSGATAADPRLGAPRDSFYAWTWGDCLLVVLDPFWYTTDKPRTGVTDANWGWTLGEAQYRWLVATLERSTARHKLVFVHHLVGGGSEGRGGVEVAGGFEWGGRNADGTPGFDARRPGWGRPIHQVLVDTGVGAVFHGHDHVYVHQQLDGIVYQLLPQPSNAQTATAHLAAEYGYRSGEVVDGSGHLRVTVSPTSVVGEFVRVRRATPGAGEVAHRFELPSR